MELGRRIKHYRIERGWTLEKLATEINFAKNTVHNWENNKREPDNQTIRSIANALGISIINLFKKEGLLNMNFNEDLRYIGTRHLEEMDPDIPVEVLNWLENFIAVEEEAGYPAMLKGTYGYMIVMEYWHNEIERDIVDYGDWQNIKSNDLLSFLQETAQWLETLEPNIKVIVGDKTAPLSAHEFCIFIPFGTEDKTYKDILESWKYAEIKAKNEA
ncbi:helix-turn-helix transcriptional regulator [Bacillus mexicanus]|uniref:helix-turn-helix domain-containing protein n=1 Tax=Bacillus mexicanus TaxID=2834415 RepID=UPI003D1D3B7D